MKTTTTYGLQVAKALTEHWQGLSVKELQKHCPANNLPEVVRGLRNNYGFRDCLKTRYIKRPERARYGVYYLTNEGMTKARQLLEGARTETTTATAPTAGHSSSKGGAHE